MDSSVLNVWIPVIAIAMLAQAAAVIVSAVLILRRLDRAEARLDAVASEVRPIAARLSSALEDLADLSARLRRLDTRVTAAADSVANGVEHVKTAVLMRAWPAVGVARAAAAAIRAFRRRRRPAVPDSRLDALALARFVNEGGQHG